MRKFKYRLYWVVLLMGAKITSPASFAQNVSAIKSGRQELMTPDSISQKIKFYYSNALKYKNGIHTAIDYPKAFTYFKAAADLGDPQSIYAMAYFYYKGFVEQNYQKAIELFKRGAYIGRVNSQYFLGLMFRNGYGETANQDSARFWLQKAADQGYSQAIEELRMKEPENNENAAVVLSKINHATETANTPLNQFIHVLPEVPDSIAITGSYQGYIITYDWSGQHIISARKLKLDIAQDVQSLSKAKENIQGNLLVGGDINIAFKAKLQNGILLFDSAAYNKTDHYSPERAIRYNLQTASLKLYKYADSVFLTAEISMFSPQRNEPAKPTVIALIKDINASTDLGVVSGTKTSQDSSQSYSTYTAIHLLKVFPNPFNSYINISFEVLRTSATAIALYTLSGQKLYYKPAELLQPGKYSIKIEPANTLTGQTYLLKVGSDIYTESIKVIKK